MTEIVFPEFGEGSEETAKVVCWLFEPGDRVDVDDELLELLTDKATFTVPSPVAGRLQEIRTPADAEVQVGDVLGLIDENAG